MAASVTDLASKLVSFNSVWRNSNEGICDYLQELLAVRGFAVERLEYEDQGKTKVSLVAVKGRGQGGLGLFSHSDTVPADNWDSDPFEPRVEDGRLFGLGSCDMKGPLAATIMAGTELSGADLEKPFLLAITADEESGYGGAEQVVRESELFRQSRPACGIIAEPTRLLPIYAHKGSGRCTVTAFGRAAHTSTDMGESSNFKIAPFLAEMAELAERFKTDDSFQNREYSPPTNGFNMVLDDGGTAPNIFAPKTVCILGFRSMPDARSKDAIRLVEDAARRHGLEVESCVHEPFHVSPSSTIVQAALEATGIEAPDTVAFGTEASIYKNEMELVILGPGNIEQAHTVNEWIELRQLEQSVSVYQRMIRALCG